MWLVSICERKKESGKKKNKLEINNITSKELFFSELSRAENIQPFVPYFIDSKRHWVQDSLRLTVILASQGNNAYTVILYSVSNQNFNFILINSLWYDAPCVFNSMFVWAAVKCHRRTRSHRFHSSQWTFFWLSLRSRHDSHILTTGWSKSIVSCHELTDIYDSRDVEMQNNCLRITEIWSWKGATCCLLEHWPCDQGLKGPHSSQVRERPHCKQQLFISHSSPQSWNFPLTKLPFGTTQPMVSNA